MDDARVKSTLRGGHRESLGRDRPALIGRDSALLAICYQSVFSDVVVERARKSAR